MILSQLDLNLLLVLDTVLTERSVARAARRLHVTPSAVSNSLARLRSTLGDPLVIRSGSGVVPTPRAAALAQSLKRGLTELERAVAKDTFDPATTTRQFTLALADAVQLSRLPQIVRLCGNEMPHAGIHAVGIETYLASGGLSGLQVDVAIIALEEKAPGIHVTPLYQEESVLVARRSHRRIKGRITKKQLAELRHVDVQVAPGRGYRELARSYERLGIVREVAVVVPSFIAAASVIAKTDFVATLPASLVEVLGERLGLRVLAAPAPRMITEVKLAWHERTHDDPAMRAFRDVVARAASEAGHGGRATADRGRTGTARAGSA